MSKAKALLPLVGVAILLAIWTIVTWLKLVDPVLLPSPWATFRTLWQGMADGKLGVAELFPEVDPVCDALVPIDVNA
jgi:NitT/TauT family transport system permease protein